MRRLQRKFSKPWITILLFGAVLLVVGIAVGGYLSIPRERLLLERATKVSSISDPEDSDVTLQIRDDYHWIATDKLLFFRGYWNPGELSLWERDLSTGTNRPLPTLTRLFNQSFLPHGEQIVSPDGKRLLWRGREGILNMATLDGSSHFQWATPSGELNNPLCWSADSKQVIELVNANNSDGLQFAILTDVKDVHHLKTLRFSANTLLNAEADHFVFHPDQTLTAAPYLYNSSLASAIQVDLKTGVEKQVYTQFPGSVSWVERTAALSPDGKRIAWNVAYMTYDQPRAFLHRYFSAIPVTRHRYQAIWISRTDGGSAEEIGRVAVAKDQEYIENLNVKWLPGGRRISFVYGDHLWTISADL